VERPPISPTDFASVVTAVTSAFGDPTRRAIYLFVHESTEQRDGATASGVAQQFELHPNVARHHLDKLVAGGYVVVDVARTSGGGAGRPSKRYRVAGEGGISLELPLRHDDVLTSLLGRALQELGPERSERLAEEVGVEYGRAMAGQMSPGSDRHRSFQAALHTVADALTAHGFASHAEDLNIVNENCPFGGVVIDHPVICAVDRGMVQGMLETLYGRELITETALSLPTGGERCVTAVQGN
jgi:predicted ArsR family transcriptional regulator